MQTTLELYLCSNLGEDTVLYHRSCRDISHGLADPDSLLPPMFLALGITAEEDGTCAHSTSWRYDKGRILLTYLAWLPLSSIVRLPTQVLNLNETSPCGAAGPLRPRPVNIAEEQVVVHGLRHIRYLVDERREPNLSATIQATGATAMLSLLEPALAGRLYMV
jgi:hypothetical protein